MRSLHVFAEGLTVVGAGVNREVDVARDCLVLRWESPGPSYRTDLARVADVELVEVGRERL